MSERTETPDDDDRLYLVSGDWLCANVVRLPDLEPPKFELLTTDDPNKYRMRITQPAPRFLIKRT